MVLGLPCQLDYRNVTYAFQRTFGHLLPRRLQNRDYIEGPHDRHDYPPTSPGGHGTSLGRNDHTQAIEPEKSTNEKDRDPAVYQNEPPSTTTSSLRKSGTGSSQRSSINGAYAGKKEVRWDGGVVGGDEQDSTPRRAEERDNIGQAV
ncbi:hypothetical protein ABW21_db0206493 [Orbilia brochopaga]|nr:hypothetical protein ABW21_db0206493 [Drechslerella brochopaga]